TDIPNIDEFFALGASSLEVKPSCQVIAQNVHGGNSKDEMNVFLSVCGPGILAASKIKKNLSNLNCLFASPQVEDKLDQWLTLLPDEEI
ncbi:10150_t:CDS:2, partial [Racocetra persica]